MNNRLVKGILYNLNNVASYNNCGLDRLVRIDENNHELFGCKECVFKDSVCYHYAELKDVKKVVR